MLDESEDLYLGIVVVMADVALDSLHPIQLGYVDIRHPFDDGILLVAERGAFLVLQILEILESLYSLFSPEGYRSRKHDLSGKGVSVLNFYPKTWKATRSSDSNT